MSNKPYTIGITGGSGSGKSFFIKELAQNFKTRDLCLISQDHYYRPITAQVRDDHGIENFDLPGSIDDQLFVADIQKLKRGETVKKAAYTFNRPEAEAKILTFEPAPILILEGLFIQYFPEIAAEVDLRIFIDAKDHLKLSRRIQRDNHERGYDLNDVLYRYQFHVMPVYESLIAPLKYQADLVVPNNHGFRGALEMLTAALKTKIAEAGQ